jgi:hypothetical protein
MSWQRRIVFAASAMTLLGMISSAALGQTDLFTQEKDEETYKYWRSLAFLFTGVLAPLPTDESERFQARIEAAIAQARAMPGGHCAGAVPGATLVQHDPDPNVGLAMNRECWGGNQSGGVVR